MNEKKLEWKEENRKKVYGCRIFSVYESQCRSPDGILQLFNVIESLDWAIVIPVLDNKFIMVRQWRHGSQGLSLEFPGGVFEPGEDPQAAAARELLEETGYKPGKMRKIGEFNPNPAIMTNNVHIFLAENLVNTGSQDLDADELVEVELVSIDEAIQGMGKPPFVHALMGSAIALYLVASSGITVP